MLHGGSSIVLCLIRQNFPYRSDAALSAHSTAYIPVDLECSAFRSGLSCRRSELMLYRSSFLQSAIYSEAVPDILDLSANTSVMEYESFESFTLY
jgi:hypothetical protein